MQIRSPSSSCSDTLPDPRLPALLEFGAKSEKEGGIRADQLSGMTMSASRPKPGASYSRVLTKPAFA